MTVKCKLDINSVGKLIGLTIDKSYKITDISPIGYRIIDNELRNFWYTKDLFYSISDERNRKIENLLNDRISII
jgi:hypothetical protein